MPVPDVKEPSAEISDEEYARLSAEKQVFEKAKNRGEMVAKKASGDKGKGEEDKEDVVTNSSASSVNLGPIAGEVVPPRTAVFLPEFSYTSLFSPQAHVLVLFSHYLYTRIYNRLLPFQHLLLPPPQVTPGPLPQFHLRLSYTPGV